MAVTPTMLIVTTDSESSLSLFETKESASLIRPFAINYSSKDISKVDMLQRGYDYVYFRDPFNNPSAFDKEKIEETIEAVLNSSPKAYFVDGVKNLKQMSFEDKWVQYQAFSQFMPDTKLLESISSVDFHNYIAKKRISSRSRDIVFSSEDLPEKADLSDYIYQSKLDIEAEYRVFMIGEEIVLPIATKSSKTDNQAVKIVGETNELPAEIKTMCESVYKLTKFDFIGLDIALVGSRYFLLEVNRSCQFNGYLRQTSVNLATNLNKYLLGVRPA